MIIEHKIITNSGGYIETRLCAEHEMKMAQYLFSHGAWSIQKIDVEGTDCDECCSRGIQLELNVARAGG